MEDRVSGKGPAGGGGRPGAVLAWVGWWLVSAAVWMVLVDEASVAELVAGAIVAAVGASLAVLVRSQRRAVLRPEMRWLLRLWRPTVRYPVDLFTLARVLARTVILGRPSVSRTLAVPFVVVGRDGRAAARRTFAQAAATFAPNTLVIGQDERSGVLLIHQLVPSKDPAGDADPLRLA